MSGGGPRTGSLLVAGQRVTVFQASPTVFTDHPIERGMTPVRPIHFLELRARIDTLRAGAALPAFPWTDPGLVPGITPIKRVHLTELRAVGAVPHRHGRRDRKKRYRGSAPDGIANCSRSVAVTSRRTEGAVRPVMRREIEVAGGSEI